MHLTLLPMLSYASQLFNRESDQYSYTLPHLTTPTFKQSNGNFSHNHLSRSQLVLCHGAVRSFHSFGKFFPVIHGFLIDSAPRVLVGDFGIGFGISSAGLSGRGLIVGHGCRFCVWNVEF